MSHYLTGVTVHDANGQVADASSGNYDPDTIDLSGLSPGGAVQQGANYTVRANGGESYSTMYEGPNGSYDRFRVYS